MHAFAPQCEFPIGLRILSGMPRDGLAGLVSLSKSKGSAKVLQDGRGRYWRILVLRTESREQLERVIDDQRIRLDQDINCRMLVVPVSGDVALDRQMAVDSLSIGRGRSSRPSRAD